MSQELTSSKITVQGKRSPWPLVIGITSIIFSVVAVSIEDQAPTFSDSLVTIGGVGLFVSAIWYFIRRIRSNDWRKIDKIVLGLIAALFLVAVLSLTLL